jgi:hypothetical protein
MLGSLFATVFIPRFRLKPDFADPVLALHVNVRRLGAVEAREEETIGAGMMSC